MYRIDSRQIIVHTKRCEVYYSASRGLKQCIGLAFHGKLYQNQCESRAIFGFPLNLKTNRRLIGSKAQKRYCILLKRTLNNTDRHFLSKPSESTFKESFQKYIFIWTPALSFTVKEHTNAEINDKYNEEQTGKLALCIGFSEHEQKKGNWSYYKATYFTSSPTTQNGT